MGKLLPSLLLMRMQTMQKFDYRDGCFVIGWVTGDKISKARIVFTGHYEATVMFASDVYAATMRAVLLHGYEELVICSDDLRRLFSSADASSPLPVSCLIRVSKEVRQRVLDHENP